LADFNGDAGTARRAAYRLAVALGHCRLYGIDLGDQDGTLLVAVGVAAARQLADYVHVWKKDAHQLPRRWEQAAEPQEAADYVVDLLTARMEAWAAFLAIDEAYQECLESAATQEAAFAAALDAVLAALGPLDEALRQHLHLLALAADTRLLENWRGLLAEEYRASLPWWLDGRLEKKAESIAEVALVLQPRPHREEPTMWSAAFLSQLEQIYNSLPVGLDVDFSPRRRSGRPRRGRSSLPVASDVDLGYLADRFDEWRRRTREVVQTWHKEIPDDDPVKCKVSLFRTMDAGRLERAHTRTLAWLLDPKMNDEHGFGDTLVGVLIRRLARRDLLDGFQVDVVAPDRLIEVSGKSGLLDVFAEGTWKDDGRCVPWTLVIEAKVDALEGKKQLALYDKWLSSHAAGREIFRVFLTPEGRAPTTGTKRWESLSFLELVRTFRGVYGGLRPAPGFHFLRLYLAGVLQDICGWPRDITGEAADPYAVASYLKTIHNFAPGELAS
jgi:hypothetical protein